jgi:predicted nucleic acid-binding protein
MVAATAIANDLTLYTCNPGDFKGIGDLRVVAIHPDST